MAPQDPKSFRGARPWHLGLFGGAAVLIGGALAMAGAGAIGTHGPLFQAASDAGLPKYAPPTDAERDLESRIERARVDLLERMREQRDSYLNEGEKARAQRLEGDIEVFDDADFSTDMEHAPRDLLAALIAEGRVADAIAVADAMGMSGDPLAERARKMGMPRTLAQLGLPEKYGTAGADRERIFFEGDKLTFEVPGILLFDRPELFDFEMSGKIRLAKGRGFRLLLRRYLNDHSPNAYIHLRLPVIGDQLGARGAKAEWPVVELSQKGRTPVVQNLKTPVALPGMVEFVVRVEGRHVTVWIDREPLVADDCLYGLELTPSGIGFYAEPDDENRAEVTVSELTIKPLRAAPHALSE